MQVCEFWPHSMPFKALQMVVGPYALHAPSFGQGLLSLLLCPSIPLSLRLPQIGSGNQSVG